MVDKPYYHLPSVVFYRFYFSITNYLSSLKRPFYPLLEKFFTLNQKENHYLEFLDSFGKISIIERLEKSKREHKFSIALGSISFTSSKDFK